MDGLPAAFFEQVKDALEHLHDLVHLRDHPFAIVLLPAHPQSGAARGQALRRILLDAIETLKAEGYPASGRQHRIIQVLDLRYIEALPYREVMSELGLSQSQYHREQRHAVETMALLLWDRRLDSSSPTRPERGRMPTDAFDRDIAALAHTEGPLDVCEVVRGVAAVLAPLAIRRGVSIHEHVPAGGILLPANRTALRQLLISLAECLLQPARTGKLTLGCGMADGSVSLTVAYEPSLGAESQPVAIPAEQPPAVQQLLQMLGGTLAREQSAQAETLLLTLPLPGRCLLVVDDNPDMVQLLTRYLAGQAIAIVAAETVEDGISLAARTRPDLIILDVMLPKRDGWDALQALRHHPTTQAVPIIVCTVLDEAELALALGASAFIRKPLTRPALLLAIQQWSPLPAAAHPE
jgi:CheY-like chemotaxis protein